MCDGIKNMKLLKQQYNKAVDESIEIIEIEFILGHLRYRDRWSVKKILDVYELSKLDMKKKPG